MSVIQRNELLSKSLQGFYTSLELVEEFRLKSAIHTSLAIVHDALGNSTLRAGHIVRACELDLDNIPARGVKIALDKIELNTHVNMSSYIQAIAGASSSATASANSSATVNYK